MPDRRVWVPRLITEVIRGFSVSSVWYGTVILDEQKSYQNWQNNGYKYVYTACHVCRVISGGHMSPDYNTGIA